MAKTKRRYRMPYVPKEYASIMKGPQWVKPEGDGLTRDVAHYIAKTGISVLALSRKTGVSTNTIYKIIDGVTVQATDRVKEQLLRVVGKELVVRDRGSNR